MSATIGGTDTASVPQVADAADSPSEPKPKKPKVTSQEAERGDGYSSRKEKSLHPGSYADPEFRAWRNMDSLPTPPQHPTTAKRKVAMLIGYKGTKYGGFQINPGQRTLQSEIELALYTAGLIRKENFGYPQKYGWSTSGRTDKGVHAAAQTISCKIEMAPDSTMGSLREKLNEVLEGTDITILGVERTTRMFCAKKARDRVRYRYLIPSFLLDPNIRDILQSTVKYPANGQPSKVPVSPGELKALWPQLQSIRSTDAQRELLASTLSMYSGTHRFHNFTQGVSSSEGRAKRYIVSFIVHDPIVHNGLEWIPTAVLGQSFLLHQIRKMVGCAVAIVRGVAPPNFLETTAFNRNVRHPIPTAPAQGLFLEMSYYELYNDMKNKRNPDHGAPDLVWHTTEGPLYERWAQCVHDISTHMMEKEEECGNFVQYLYTQTFLVDQSTQQFPERMTQNEEKRKAAENAAEDLETKEATSE